MNNRYISTFFIVCVFSISAVIAPTAAHAFSVDAIISDQSTQVSGGDRLYFEVDIKYPENTTRQDLRLEYQIKENGKVIETEKVLRAVETQASFLDYLVVPKDIKGGIHELNVIVKDYKGNLNKSVSATFDVTQGIDEITKYFFIILAVILFVTLLVIVQIFILSRKGR